MAADGIGQTRTCDAYEKIAQIGEGTYGKVYKARCRRTGKIVALKKMRVHQQNKKEGYPLTAVREIKILKRLRHPNMVEMMDVVSSKGCTVPFDDERDDDEEEDICGDLFLVLEYLDHDLTGLVDKGYKFRPIEVRLREAGRQGQRPGWSHARSTTLRTHA